MIQTALEPLKSDEFVVRFGVVSNPLALYRALRRSGEVEAVRSALKAGVITEESLRRFTAELLFDFRPGHLFPHDLALAALAVVMESRQTPFAEEFIFDLARLTVSEMPISIRIARYAVQKQLSVTRTESRSFVPPSVERHVWMVAPRRLPDPVGRTETHIVLGAK